MDRPSLFHAAGLNSEESFDLFFMSCPSPPSPPSLRQPCNGRERRGTSCIGLRPGETRRRRSLRRRQLFRQQVDVTGTRRGRPDHTSSKAVFAYFWPLWPKSKSRRRSEILTQRPSPPKAASLSLPLFSSSPSLLTPSPSPSPPAPAPAPLPCPAKKHH